MRWLEMQRMWRTLPVAGGLLLAVACGGGDNGGTGPGGSLAGNYELVGINEDGIPEEEQVENCRSALFTNGSMELDGDGNFQLSVEYENEEGPDGFTDHGQYERDGSDISFESQAWGDQFDGEVDGDLVVLYYDFCANGVADIDLVFEK